jgi:hypothetical protein
VDFSTPIKIYLGTQVEQSLAVDVLTYSIASHTQQSIQVMPLYAAVQHAGIVIEPPRQPQLRARSPFTFQRFAIPALCQYQGRAIYLDSDMLVFRDINEIWQQPFEQAHYTDMPRQPWLSVLNPLAALWCETLLKAVAEGAIARETSCFYGGATARPFLWNNAPMVQPPLYNAQMRQGAQ